MQAKHILHIGLAIAALFAGYQIGQTIYSVYVRPMLPTATATN